MNKPTLARQTNKNANSINTPRQIVAPNCAVCRAAGKSVEVCGSHWPKDRDGNTTCPTLLSQICGYCKCSGHTPKYCPVLEKQKRDDASTSSFKSTNKTYTQTHSKANPVQKQTQTTFVHNKGQFAAFANSDSESEDEEFNSKWNTLAKKPKLPIAPTLPDQFPALKMQTPATPATPETIETRPTTPTTLPPPIVSYASKAAATAFTRPHTHNTNTNLTIIPKVGVSQKDRKLQHQIAKNAPTQPCSEDANDEQEWREKQQNALHMQRYRLTKIDSDRDAIDMFVPENDNTW